MKTAKGLSINRDREGTVKVRQADSLFKCSEGKYQEGILWATSEG
jgi:hypothetical protein